MNKEQWPDGFKDCKELFRSTASDGKYPVYLGLLDNGEFLLSIGKEENPLCLPQEVLFLLYESMGKLIAKSQQDIYGVTETNLESKFLKVLKNNYGENPMEIKALNPSNLEINTEELEEGMSEETKEFVKNMGEQQVSKDAALQMLKDVMEKAKKQMEEEVEENPADAPDELINAIKDAKQIYDSLSEEEKKELVQEKEKEAFEEEEARISELEKELLGDVPSAGSASSIVKDKDYFANILEKHGKERLKEELMTLPEDERMEIMKQIYMDRKKKLNS